MNSGKHTDNRLVIVYKETAQKTQREIGEQKNAAAIYSKYKNCLDKRLASILSMAEPA